MKTLRWERSASSEHTDALIEMSSGKLGCVPTCLLYDAVAFVMPRKSKTLVSVSLFDLQKPKGLLLQRGGKYP